MEAGRHPARRARRRSLSRFEKLLAARESQREQRPLTPVYLALQSGRSYLGLSLSWAGLLQALTQSGRELEGILQMVQDEDRWSALCLAAHQLLEDFLQAPVEGELEPLCQALEQLESEFLELDLSACYARLEAGQAWARLMDHLDHEILPWQLAEGHYTTILAALEDWLGGASPGELLEAHQQRIQEQLTEYSSSYMTPEEWTLEVALADQLLQEGLECWMQGLIRLQEAVQRGQPGHVSRGLELLLAGNHKLLQAERLARLQPQT